MRVGYGSNTNGIRWPISQNIPLYTKGKAMREILIHIPVSMQSVLQLKYPIHTELVVKRSHGQPIWQSNVIRIARQPSEVTEMRLSDNGEMTYVPNISEVCVLPGTFSPDHIQRRLAKLGLAVDFQQFQPLQLDDGLLHYRAPGVGCAGFVSSDYKPRAFIKTLEGSVRYDDEPISHPQPYQPEQPTASSSGTEGSKKTDQTASATKHSDVAPSSNQTIDNDGRTYQPSSVIQSDDSWNVALTKTVEHSLGFTTLYGTYNPNHTPDNDGWTWRAQKPKGYGSSVEWSMEKQRQIEEQAERDKLRGGTYSAPGYSPSSGSSSSSSSYSGGAYSWGAGQTSTTTTDSSGTVHTIYR